MTDVTHPAWVRIPDLVQLLDDHHLAVLADAGEPRDRLVRNLAAHLRGLSDTEVLELDGTRIRSVGEFTAALLGEARDRPTLAELTRRLRATEPHVRRRYVLWNAADELLEADVASFGAAVNTLLSVAVEHEFLTEEPLVLQRVVFFGGDKLGAYAEDSDGQFRRWTPGSSEQVEDCLGRPAVITYRWEHPETM